MSANKIDEERQRNSSRGRGKIQDRQTDRHKHTQVQLQSANIIQESSARLFSHLSCIREWLRSLKEEEQSSVPRASIARVTRGSGGLLRSLCQEKLPQLIQCLHQGATCLPLLHCTEP